MATQIVVTDSVTQIRIAEADTAHRADEANPHAVTAAQVGAPTEAEFDDHSARHENGGADEISVAGLSGTLADAQTAAAHDLAGAQHNADTLANLNTKISDATLDDSGDPRDPNAHATSHQNGGGDEISVAGLSGLLGDSQTPLAHDLAGSLHNAATLSEINAKISDDDLVGIAASQTLTNKVLTSPDINGGTWNGTIDAASVASATLQFNDNIAAIFGTGSDATISYNGTNLLINPRAVGSGHLLIPGGSVMVGDTANANMTTGLTLNQGAADDEIVALKSSDVGHTMTDLAEADTYGTLQKLSATAGGQLIIGYSETNRPLQGNGRAATEDTTDTSSSVAAVLMVGQLQTSNTVGNMGTTGNVFGVANNGTTRLIVKGNGDMHITNTTLVALDSEDDIGLVRAFQRQQSQDMGIAISEWDAAVMSNSEDLKRLGVLSSEGDFVVQQRMNGLLGGAIWQLATKLFAIEQRLALTE